MKKVLIADDHPIFRAGLRQIVEEDNNYEVVAEASDGNSCITSVELCAPQYIIVDLAMPGMDGYGVLEWLEKNNPDIIAIVVSMHSSKPFATRAKELGARAFIAKEDATAEIHNALLTPKGVFYISASVGGNSRRNRLPMAVNAREENSLNLLELLSPAEIKIFELVGQSMTSKQIGIELGLSYRTIQTHRQQIVKKLNLGGPNALLEFAIVNRR